MEVGQEIGDCVINVESYRKRLNDKRKEYYELTGIFTHKNLKETELMIERRKIKIAKNKLCEKVHNFRSMKDEIAKPNKTEEEYRDLLAELEKLGMINNSRVKTEMKKIKKLYEKPDNVLLEVKEKIKRCDCGRLKEDDWGCKNYPGCKDKTGIWFVNTNESSYPGNKLHS